MRLLIEIHVQGTRSLRRVEPSGTVSVEIRLIDASGATVHECV